MAHLSGENCPLYAKVAGLSVAEPLDVTMNHMTSVLEIVVANSRTEEIMVSTLEFTAQENIVGTYYVDFTGDVLAFVASGDSYVSKTATLKSLDPEKAVIPAGESAKFYIAVKPFTAAANTTLSLSLNGAEAKVKTLESDMVFEAGVINTINYTCGDEYVAPVLPTKVTVAEFLAAAEDETIYELTGVITEVKNTTYGNFYLEDETGSVYIYGLCSPTGEQKYWAESGAKVGDTITIRTVRTSHNETPQGKNAIFVSLEPAEELEAETVIWEGTHDTAGWSGNQDLAWGGYDWSKVTAGTLLKLYVTPNDPTSDWWCISLRTAAEGWPNITGIPEQYNKPTYSITLELTQAVIDQLVAGNGLIFTGSQTTVTKVSLLPADAEVVLWEGEMTSTSYSNCQIGQVNDWLNNGVASGDKVKIYVTAGDTWAMMISDGQWKKWFATGEGGAQDGLYGQGFSNYNTDLTNGYIEFEMTEAMLTTLTGYTWGNLLIIQGDGITVTKISFK